MVLLVLKPMLKAISEDGDLRQRADRLHNAVFTPETKAYMERYHHNENTPNMDIAKDASGTTELFDDWSQPYKTKLNSVKFNGMLHTQMDFGDSV